ncbi:MAG: 1-deoxy-D-xylulose-5-phosphate synthase [Blastochloris sp.]|nr:1-deoxy-D-xylulose-5-phosphate synthase [Blastochloris sp.]
MARILDRIDSPADVKKLSIAEMEIMAGEIREELIQVCSKNGGHIGPNLGLVEVTIAMHYVFNTPKDNFIFDVSHQAYVHKLLTGRRKQFNTIRQAGGLNGFMLRTESAHDCYGAGHAGTALSAALGMATARDLRKSDEHVVALCGDAAFTCGVTYEALNNITQHTKKLIVILNDNEWSIDKNVGAIASYFNKIATSSQFSYLHDKAGLMVEKLGGKVALKYAKKAEEAAKSLLLPSVIFEEMGLTYYGPVDGHDIDSLIKMFEFLKEQDHPVLLHIITQKGKGLDLAMSKQKKYHGIGPGTFHPTDGENNATGPLTFSQVFADTLTKIADTNNKVLAITGAMPNGTALDRFQPKHPDKYFDVGIAEEHAVLFAAGLATKGYKPVCAIYSTFLQRAYDMIIHDVALQNLPVVFAMDRGSLSGDDGPTHHGLFDISYIRCVPNMIHMSPKDEDELADMLYTAVQHAGPSAIRYPRGNGPGSKVKDQPALIPIGKAEVIKHGTQVAIWSYGHMLPMGQELAALLEARGYSVAIINARFAKPLDRGTLEFFGRSCDMMVTFEDHVLRGGFGAGVIEELSDMGLSVPVVRIGWPDQFVEHGKVDFLRAQAGITAQAALEKAEPYLKKIKPTTQKAAAVA